MKTGRDANQSGLYISECCLKEVPFLKGQMFARCPRCYALTVWEFVKPVERAQVSLIAMTSVTSETRSYT
jgi:hypothetical protein